MGAALRRLEDGRSGGMTSHVVADLHSSSFPSLFIVSEKLWQTVLCLFSERNPNGVEKNCKKNGLMELVQGHCTLQTGLKYVEPLVPYSCFRR